jgi:hypothetical protein
MLAKKEEEDFGEFFGTKMEEDGWAIVDCSR